LLVRLATLPMAMLALCAAPAALYASVAVRGDRDAKHFLAKTVASFGMLAWVHHWNLIGVRGDRSCPELIEFVHCQNCPVFAAAGRRFLDAPSPEGYLDEWTDRLAEHADELSCGLISVLVFRLADEWLALPIQTLVEVTPPRPDTVDISADAVARIRENAAANGIANVDVREMNVFDELRELERTGARFETIVLDPPAFAKNKAAIRKAMSGYKEINLRALKLLTPGGFLVTCSCSYNVSEEMFLDVVSEAAADAGAEVSLVEKRAQGRDHPILINVPETYYLKCLILRKLA
jgi:predicted RNA methylase